MLLFLICSTYNRLFQTISNTIALKFYINSIDLHMTVIPQLLRMYLLKAKAVSIKNRYQV